MVIRKKMLQYINYILWVFDRFSAKGAWAKYIFNGSSISWSLALLKCTCFLMASKRYKSHKIDTFIIQFELWDKYNTCIPNFSFEFKILFVLNFTIVFNNCGYTTY